MIIQEHSYKHPRPWTMRKKTTEILLHCAATPEGVDYTVDQINDWHLHRDFNGIGYHYVIYRDGTVVRGRSESAVGAHCTGHNSISIGVCYIGGCDASGKHGKDTRTARQKTAMVQLVKELMSRYGIPKEKVFGHYQFAAKSCPSFKIEGFRESL